MAGKFHWKSIVLLFLFICFHPPSQAVDGVSLEFLSGNKSRIGTLGLQWNWDKKWFTGGQVELGGFWDVTFSRWRNTQYLNIPDNTQTLNDLGIAAAFRLQNRERSGLYTEVETGPHWLSERYDNNGRQQGSRVVFETSLGAGYVWKNGLDLGFKAMHMSNGGFRNPNDCVDVFGVNLRYWW